jgi:hypothetical protein
VHLVVVAADDIPWTASHKVRRSHLVALIRSRVGSISALRS